MNDYKQINKQSENMLKEAFQLANATDVRGGQNMANLVNIINNINAVLIQINTPPEEGEEKKEE